MWEKSGVEWPNSLYGMESPGRMLRGGRTANGLRRWRRAKELNCPTDLRALNHSCKVHHGREMSGSSPALLGLVAMWGCNRATY
jgi:hypothetical protein